MNDALISSNLDFACLGAITHALIGAVVRA
jgi:hypothetical protein